MLDPTEENAWVFDFFRDVDAMDRDRIGPWLSPNYETQLGNRPVVRGKEAALDNSARFWATLRSMRHQIEEIVIDGDRAVSLATVTYTRVDGSAVSMPVATYLRRSGEREVDRVQVYIDLAPLLES